MKQRSTTKERRSNRPLYPALIAGLGIALVGALWSLQGVEEPVYAEVATPTWQEVAAIDVGDLEPRLWEDPVDLQWKSGPPIDSTLQMHQVLENGTDIRLEVDCRESSSSKGGDRVVERSLTARAIDIRDEEYTQSPQLRAQVAAGIDSANYEFDSDKRGAVNEVRWDDEYHPSVEATPQLVRSVQELLAPRFPDEPILVGESWTYEIPLDPSVVGASDRWTVDLRATVDNQLTGVFGDGQRLVAAISRRFALKVQELSGEQPVIVEVRGTGTAYFDISSGRLVATDLGTKRNTAPSGDESDSRQPTIVDTRWVFHL